MDFGVSTDNCCVLSLSCAHYKDVIHEVYGHCLCAQCCVCCVHYSAKSRVLKFINFVVCICVHNLHCCPNFRGSFIVFMCILQCQISIHELQHSKLLQHNLVCTLHYPSFVRVHLLKLKLCTSIGNRNLLSLSICCAHQAAFGVQCVM